MSFEACAGIVERGDPDRFLAAMATPPEARARLLPILAFNVEVSRAPWLTKEPIIAEMRLQWWRDALEEIAEDRPVRRHEVATPLAEVLGREDARRLDGLVEARRWDIQRDPFEDEAALWSHLDATTGTLLWTAAAALGAPSGEEARVRRVCRPIGLAGWLRAVPALRASGRRPLPGDEAGDEGRAISEMARNALGDLSAQAGLSRPSRWALLGGWRARRVLRLARREPGRVAEGRLEASEFTRRSTLLQASALRRI